MSQRRQKLKIRSEQKCSRSSTCQSASHEKGCPLKQSRLRTLLGVVDRPERL